MDFDKDVLNPVRAKKAAAEAAAKTKAEAEEKARFDIEVQGIIQSVRERVKVDIQPRTVEEYFGMTSTESEVYDKYRLAFEARTQQLCKDTSRDRVSIVTTLVEGMKDHYAIAAASERFPQAGADAKGEVEKTQVLFETIAKALYQYHKH